MQKTIVVCGYGPGISDAVANKFGGEGFQVALVARSAGKLEKAREAFQARGVKAAAFPADLSDPNAAKDLVKRVTGQLGPITAIHWNAYANTAGDVMAADAAALRNRVRRGRHQPGLNRAGRACGSEGRERSRIGHQRRFWLVRSGDGRDGRSMELDGSGDRATRRSTSWSACSARSFVRTKSLLARWSSSGL